jgi:putative FmdB family regulatory protein
MPRYEYKCKDCENTVILSHSRKDVVAVKICPNCDSSSELERIYSFTISKDAVQKENKPGSLVKSHIEEAKEELKEEKKKLVEKDFKVC